MPIATVLLADNDPEFLTTRADYLARLGFRVIQAADPLKARQALRSREIDVAVLDIRLSNDKDERDLSGLQLARDVGATIPTIVLTGFPSADYVREALRPAAEGQPAAVAFVAKREGLEALRDAILAALSSSAGQPQARG